jgi:hypothetical protein
VRSVVFATLASAAVLLAGSGCTTTRARTASAADALERTADAFAARTCYEPTCFTSQYLAAANGFAEQAREFRQTLDVAGDRDVILAYKHLWRSYHTLHDEVYRSGDPQLRVDLKPTTQAFAIVQRNVKTGYSYADGSLYAGGAYTFNPYYN